MRCCAAAASLQERAAMILRCEWRCLCVFRICSITSCELPEGIPLSWAFQRTLCRISLTRPQEPSVRPGDVAASCSFSLVSILGTRAREEALHRGWSDAGLLVLRLLPRVFLHRVRLHERPEVREGHGSFWGAEGKWRDGLNRLLL